MTTNQTIDGVPRGLLEWALSLAYALEAGERHKELRALLDAPAVEDPIPQYFAEACDKFDWTPEEALRFYADGKHFDTDHGRTRILCTGAIASYALKGMGEDYAAMKGVEPAAKPQGEPVTMDGKTTIREYVANSVPEDQIGDDWTKGYEECKRRIHRMFQQPVNAEQPAPVAFDFELAAQKLASCMDYPWDYMPEQGRASMREHAKAIIGAAQVDPVALALPDRDRLRDLIAQAIGSDTYDCVRVWSAWGVGTMSEDDFVPVVEQEARLYEIADACLDELKRLNPSL